MGDLSPDAVREQSDRWLTGLRARQPAVISDLTDMLRRGLSKALAGRASVGPQDVDDFAQEATMHVLDKLETFRGESRLTTWAMSLAVRIALNALRRRGTGASRDVSLQSLSSEPVMSDASDVSLEKSELLTALRRAIGTALTDRQRGAVLAFLAGTPQVLIAEQLGVSAGSLHKLMHDARVRLRTSLVAAGFDPADIASTLERGGRL
jgi:RNA polymerase sigma-70 factor, ECF subfamily